EKEIKYNIFPIIESKKIEKYDEYFNTYFNDDNKRIIEKLLNNFIDAKEYGSLLKLDIEENEICILEKYIKDKELNNNNDLIDYAVSNIIKTEIIPLINISKNLIRKYDVVITNPPYAGHRNLSPKLFNFLTKEYS